MKTLIKIETKEKGIVIKYLCAENEEEYWNGNHDAYDSIYISFDDIKDIEDENEIKYLASLRDASYNEKDIVIL